MEHAPNLTLPGGPPLPPEERDRPNDSEIVKKVLSRDGYRVFPPRTPEGTVA